MVALVQTQQCYPREIKLAPDFVLPAGEPDHEHEHPAIVTRVWGSREPTPTINVKVLPDCGEPYDATSIQHWKSSGSKYHYRLRDEAIAL